MAQKLPAAILAAQRNADPLRTTGILWLLASQRSREVAKEVVTQYEQHLQQAKGFFEVGTKPKFDVIKAQAELSTARLNLIKAENALKIAKVTLNMPWAYRMLGLHH